MNLSFTLLILFIVVVGIQALYYLSFLFNFGLSAFQRPTKKSIGLSVIICAKNEAENLRTNLPAIITQKYDDFEIVLVNDSSNDATLEVMTEFENTHPNIKVVDVKSNEAFWGNKKYALTLGIKASKHDFLVFTDADCHPISEHWLSDLSRHFSNEKSIVLGYGAYAKKGHSFLNKIIRYETLLTALQYFSYAKIGLPYMGVGRNMAYRKSLFFNNSGFSNHMTIRSGDDDLFINEVANKTNTAICVSPTTFTISTPKTSFRSWILQKRRHISTASHYKTIHKVLLSNFYLSQLFFWILAPIVLTLGLYWKAALTLIIVRIGLQLTAVGTASKKLHETDLIILAPILEVFLISVQLIIFISNLLSRPRHWK